MDSSLAFANIQELSCMDNGRWQLPKLGKTLFFVTMPAYRYANYTDDLELFAVNYASELVAMKEV